MPNKFSKKELQTEEWLKKARDDELNANSILTHRDGTPNGVCFLSQQMAEKYLKAFLVYHKKWYPKIHPLDVLWELCREINSSFKKIKKEAVFLTTFYVATRYPGDYPDFTWKDAEKAFKSAQKIKKFVLKRIK
jgi:HEPN domain-containing protein